MQKGLGHYNPALGLSASAADWDSLPARRSADADLDQLVALLLARAQRELFLPLLTRQLEGRRLLKVSREFIRRSLQWAFAYRATGDPACQMRARQEMLNVARFSDWHPEHFLDVAEMTTGMALALDWLSGTFSGAEQQLLHQAILTKGIAKARHGHPSYRTANNWNQVCIGGMVLGALTIAPEQTALAADLLAAARQSVPIGLSPYQPDGIYPEGPAYWEFGTSYSILLVAALRARMGEDWGIL